MLSIGSSTHLVKGRLMGEEPSYRNWRSLDAAIKDAAKKAARETGVGISAATVDARIAAEEALAPHSAQ